MIIVTHFMPLIMVHTVFTKEKFRFHKSKMFVQYFAEDIRPSCHSFSQVVHTFCSQAAHYTIWPNESLGN